MSCELRVARLKTEKIFGVLLMASENATRFYADMGTMFISRIGQVFAHCAARNLTMVTEPVSTE